jgi:hypothetical protein
VPEFANLLRQRLASRAASWVLAEASHPDADTLTAYVERLLPAPEGQQVLEHVAVCSHCREIVATAMTLPELEGLVSRPEAVVMAPALRRRWFSWSPRWGLAASLAVLAVIATVVLTVSRKKPMPPEQAKVENTAPVGVPPATQPVQPADSQLRASAEASVADSDTRSSTAGLTSSRLAARHEMPRVDRLASVPPVRATGAAVPIVAADTHGAGAIEAYSRGVPEARRDYLNNEILAANTTFSVNGQVPDISVTPAPSSNKDLFQNSLNNAKAPMPFADLPSQNQGVKIGHASAPPSRFGVFIFGPLKETKKVFRGRPGPAISPNVETFAMSGGQLNPLKEKNQTAEIAPAPPTGKDASELDHSSAFTFSSRAKAEASYASATKADKKAESSPGSWKTDGGRLLRCESSTACVEGYTGNEGITFSIVRAHGSEIWAGGNDAALVHSRDGGATWERITLGASAKGTITGIDARGANIHVQSSSGQSWSSQDSGKSWSLQE